MQKSVLEAIKTRYSCRAFTDKCPSDADLQTIAEAGVAAPSAMNVQPWRIIAVTDKELLAELEAEALGNIKDAASIERIKSRGGKVFYNTPCQIIIPIAADETNRWVNLDCGIITQNITLAAESLGINSLICGMINLAFDGEKCSSFRKRLGVPDGYEIGISVLLGYADEAGIKEPHEPDTSKISWVK